MTKLTIGIGEDFPVEEKAEDRRGETGCRHRRHHHPHDHHQDHHHDLHARWHQWMRARFGRSQKKDAEH